MTRLTPFYDRTGQPIDAQSWARLMNDFAYTQLEADFVRQVFVSPRWIGVDRRPSQLDGEPLVFETTVSDDGVHVDVRHYASERAARTGHRVTVKRLRRRDRRRMMLPTIAGATTGALLWHLIPGWWF